MTDLYDRTGIDPMTTAEAELLGPHYVPTDVHGLPLHESDKEEALNPDWEGGGRIHNWRTYASEELIRLWPSFNEVQKYAIFAVLSAFASSEEWE